MMRVLRSGLASRSLRVGLPAARWGSMGMVSPAAFQAPMWHAAAPLHYRSSRWHTTAMSQPSSPRPNPTPWQWRTHPSWARQSPSPYQAPRAAMAGLASVPFGAVPRGSGFALGGVDDFDLAPEAPVAVPTSGDSNPILTPETAPVLSQAQRALLPTATDDFREIREQKLLFVDKSGFISELVRDSTKASLITRPRRSGKTTAMKMAACFLDQRYRDQSAKWFEELAVLDDPEAVEHMGKYPVIFLDLKSAGAGSYRGFISAIARMMLKSYQSFPELSGTRGYESTLDVLWKLRGIEATPEIEDILKSSLADLTELIATSTGQKPWVLIDEYDAPIQRGYSAKQQFHEEAIEFMKDFLGGALKGNPNLHKAVMTGVMRVAIASLFSGVNNVKVRSVLDRQYSQHFGFTESEVKWLLGKFDHSADMAEVRRWYNGYTVGGYMLYNPVSIIDYIDNGFRFDPYWLRTGQEETGLLGDMLREFAESDRIGGLEVFNRLMTPKPNPEQNVRTGMYHCITRSINPSTTYRLPISRYDDSWSLMLQSGYLTARERLPNGKYKLSIPNYEVTQIFADIMAMWFAKDLGLSRDGLERLYEHLKNDRLETFCTELQSCMKQIPSVYNFARYPEAFYQGFMMGVMLHFSPYYLTSMDREAGGGRYDMFMLPKKANECRFMLDSGRRCLLLEFKAPKTKEAMQSSVREALLQVQDKEYTTEALRYGAEHLTCVGIAFHGKEMEFGIERYTLDRIQGIYVREEPVQAAGKHTARVEAERSMEGEIKER